MRAKSGKGLSLLKNIVKVIGVVQDVSTNVTTTFQSAECANSEKCALQDHFFQVLTNVPPRLVRAGAVKARTTA